MSVRATEAPPWRDEHRVAVIVVNYGTPQLTIACLDSLLMSKGVDSRIIVVDNASQDDSVERLRARLADVPTATLHSRSTNDGYTGGNNAGIALARQMNARFALVLNSDTMVDPDCVRLLVQAAESDTSIAAATPRIFFGDTPDRLWFGGARFSLWRGRARHVGFQETAERGWTEARDLDFASGCAMLIKLETVDDGPAGVFDASLFAYAEDLDLSIRLRRAGYRIRYVPDARMWHFEGSSHRRAGGQALRFYLSTRNLLRVVARYARWYHWPTLAPSLVVDVVGRFCAVAVRDRDGKAFVAVLRGAWHSVTGGRLPIEGPT